MTDFRKLHFDNEENPRLPAKFAGADDRDILNHMVLHVSLPDLMRSVGEKGFFGGEPLLVLPDEKRGGHTVVEGNRRLGAVRLLHNPDLSTVKRNTLRSIAERARHKPEKMPVIIYTSRDEILDYLGYRHITGIKDWTPLSKAKYLRQLYERSEEETPDRRCRELARIIGSRSDYVRKLLCSLSVHDRIRDSGYSDMTGSDDLSFSLLTTALGYSNIQEFLELDWGGDVHSDKMNKARLRELTIWLFDRREGRTRVGESRNLRQLAGVVANEASLSEFRNGKPLESAYMVSEGAQRTVIEAIWDAGRKLDLAYKYARGVTLDSGERRQLSLIADTARAIRKLTAPEYDD